MNWRKTIYLEWLVITYVRINLIVIWKCLANQPSVSPYPVMTRPIKHVNPNVHIAYKQHTLFHCFYSLGHTRHYANWNARLIYTFWTLMFVQSWRQTILIYLGIGVRMLRKQFKLLLQLLYVVVERLYNSLVMDINWMNYSTGATSGAGTAYPSGAPEFTPGF